MFIVEFYKEEEEQDYHKVYVFNYIELLQLLNYIDKFEYLLESVRREQICIGYKEFKDFDQEQEKKKGSKK